MTKVMKHPRGVIITTDDAELREKITRLVRLNTHRGVAWLLRGDFILSVDLLPQIFEVVHPEHSSWDEQLLDSVQAELEHRSHQLRAKLEVSAALIDPQGALSNYELKYRLDAHQLEAVAAIAAPSLRGLALFDEQGTGKTVSALCGFDRLRQLNLVDRMLVIAPKSVLGSWQQDAKMLFDDGRYVLRVATGNPNTRRKQMIMPHSILVTSYSIAVREQDFLSMIVAAAFRYLLVIDESFFVKNPRAQRTQAISRIREHCERAIVLCGTPTPNSPHDIVQQINIVDKGIAFGSRHIPEDNEIAQDVIARYLEDAIFLRRLKHEVLPNIPSKQIDRIVFPLQPQQQIMYDQVSEKLIFDVRGVDDFQFARNLSSFLARRSTLMRVCSHPGGIDPLYDETPVKHLVLDDLLRRLIEEEGKKVVIWSYFRHSLDILNQRYAHFGLARIDGSVTSIEERIEAIHRFQNESEVRIFLGNAAAAGAGITLTAASHAVYESFSNQAAHYMQSVDRIHRRGQEEDVHIHVLLAQDTIEESEFDRILDKERAGRDLLGDVYEEPLSRERFLASLGARLE